MRRTLVRRMEPYVSSIFGEMSTIALQTGAINLGQGFPDTDGPDEVKLIAQAAIAEGRGNQYPPVHGLPDLRAAIAEHQSRFYGLSIDPDTDVVVTTGASEAIQSALLALCDSGDEVIVFEPWFDIYAVGIDLAHATRVSVPLRPPDFRPDIEALRAAITPRTRLLLLNSPHNPTGVVFTREELQAIAALVIEHDLIVIADEAYEHLWYDGHPHIPIATLPGMAERTVTIGSAGKSFSFTGWKVGWATGPSDLIRAVRAVRQHLTFVSGGPFQYAIAHALRMPDSYYDDFRHGLQHQRDILTSGLRELGFTAVESEGTYFLTTDLGPLSDYADALTAARDLPGRAGVVAIPLQAFCDHAGVGDRALRWAYCKRPEVLREALGRLAALG
ncbi:MAG: pyridoxal phosphate-dependent aminotransferase [Candidatus Nanopelagicales bacterium]|jgi:N-succinyldiaminopimelate aminotransferase